MARLGELLVAAGMLTAEQVEQGLRAQVMWGGRIGTNLVELGYIDLDKLANALGKQHHLPAALGRHFDRGDADLQRKLSCDLAEKYSCVPLLHAGPGGSQIIVASIAPLNEQALAIIAGELGVPPKAIIQSIAGELRVRYHLERIYRIARGTRFLRSRGKTIPPFPQFEIDPLAFEDSAVDVPVTLDDAPTQQHSTVVTAPPVPDDIVDADEIGLVDDDEDFADVHAELRARIETRAASKNARHTTVPPPIFDDDIEAIFDNAAIPEDIEQDDSSGRERRHYVRTLDSPPSADSERSLGRIPIKRVQLGAAVDEAPVMGQTLGEATRAIRRSTDRDRVAELVCETLFRFMLSCDAALMLVVRGDAAMSWKGFARSGATVPEVAVPLDQPGLLPRVIEHNTTLRLACGDLGPIDQLLLVSLGAQTGDLVVVPVSISGQVMCVLAMATQHDIQAATAESIAAAAGAAFARLMRNASR